MKNRENPGATGLLIVIIGVSLWCFANAAHRLAPNETVAFVIWNLRIGTTAVTIVGWFLTVTEYLNVWRPNKRVVGGLLALPVASQLFVWTNPIHYLHYREQTVFLSVESIVTNYGPVFYINASYLYLLGIGGMALLLTEAVNSQRLRRRQSVALLASAVPVLVTNLAHLTVLRQVDVTSFGFVVTVCIIGWALFHGQFLDVIPVARDRLVENISDPVVTLDTDDRVVDCNPAARELFEISETYLGMSHDVFFARFSSLVDQITGIADAETEITVSDGPRQRHFALRISTIQTSSGDQIGRLIVFREITDQKHRERALEDKNERLDQFASFVSHDLRNPLQIATGHVQLLQETGNLDHVEQVEDSLTRMEEMIADLRALTNADRGSIETEALDLETVAREGWSQVETGDATLEIHAPCRFSADRELVLHIFENLFRNSVEHGRTDGSPLTVTVGRLAGDGFYVEDDGSGIPEEERETILEYGYSGSNGGTGFGLAIVRTTADAHGWEIEVTESDAGGARFEFTGVDLIE